MSWFSKITGQDKHPEQRDAINAILRGIVTPQWQDAKVAFFAKAEAQHVPGPTALILWNTLCKELKVPEEMR